MEFINQIGRVFDIFLTMLNIAGLTVLVTSPFTAGVINAFGNAFANGLRAAMGR